MPRPDVSEHRLDFSCFGNNSPLKWTLKKAILFSYCVVGNKTFKAIWLFFDAPAPHVVVVFVVIFVVVAAVVVVAVVVVVSVVVVVAVVVIVIEVVVVVVADDVDVGAQLYDWSKSAKARFDWSKNVLYSQGGRR